MATRQKQQVVFDVGPLADYLIETDGLKRFIETVGITQVIDAIGAEQFLAEASPQQREELRRLLNQQGP